MSIVEDSFHGKLLATVVSHWNMENLFKNIDEETKSKLQPLLQKLNIGAVELNWNKDSDLTDKGKVSGCIKFTDECDRNRALEFVTGVITKTRENEEKN